MTDSSEKSALAAKVVDALFGNMLARPLKVKQDWPAEVKARMRDNHNTFRENHRRFSLELYEKHMTAEQLQALLDFHTGDMGESIRAAQETIQKELSKKYRELEAQKDQSKQSGPVVVRKRIFDADDEEDTDGMKPRLSVITLGVDDLERSLVFYRDGLGLPTAGIVGQEFEHGAVVFIDLQPGLRLALWPRSSIAHDTGLKNEPSSPTAFTLGHNVSSRADVDRVMGLAEAAGATITKPAHETFWGGYAGYFQDPDGHVWEVVWNPVWQESTASG